MGRGWGVRVRLGLADCLACAPTALLARGAAPAPPSPESILKAPPPRGPHLDSVHVRRPRPPDPLIKVSADHGAHPVPGVQLQQQAAVDARVHEVRALDALAARDDAHADRDGEALRGGRGGAGVQVGAAGAHTPRWAQRGYRPSTPHPSTGKTRPANSSSAPPGRATGPGPSENPAAFRPSRRRPCRRRRRPAAPTACWTRCRCRRRSRCRWRRCSAPPRTAPRSAGGPPRQRPCSVAKPRLSGGGKRRRA
jgi:hypothetical protein